MKQLIKLPNGNYINPKNVSSVYFNKGQERIWVVLGECSEDISVFNLTQEKIEYLMEDIVAEINAACE